MKYVLLAALLATAPLAASTQAPQAPQASQHQHTKVKAEELKSWYEQKKPMIVLDARTKPYFDGVLLPNAKWVPADSSEADILVAAPTKDALIVVYCAGVRCPASGMLYDKLAAMGYTNVYDYHEGLEEWESKGYPTTKK